MLPHARHPRIIVALLAVSVGLLAVPALASAAAPPGSASSATQEWAYGAHWGAHRSGAATWGTTAGTYAATVFFGWESILTQTDTSPTTFLVNASWTGAAYLWVTYCSPSCHNPSVEANVTDHALERISATTEFTTAASVNESGSAVAALGITQADAKLSANLSENTSLDGSGLGTGSHTAMRQLAVSDLETAQVAFTPALGLVPLTLAPNSSWTAEASYSGLGTWNATFAYNAVNLAGQTTSLSANPTGSIPSSGEVTLVGSAAGPASLAGGVSATSVPLSLVGPFTLVDGAVLVPAATEMLHPTNSGSDQPWTSERAGNQTISLSDLDVLSSETPHLGIVASAMTYSSVGSIPPATSTTEFVSMSTAAQSTESQFVQGEPQSVSTAETGVSCLETGVDCGSPSSGLSTELVQAIVAIGVVVALGAIVAALVVERRRRLPPPPHPFASQYSPGVARPPDSPSGVRAPPGSVPKEPTAPDPLDHLW